MRFSRARVCLKIAFRQMCVTLCGRFGSSEGGVVGYVDRMKAKSPTKWGVYLAGINFQTLSRIGDLQHPNHQFKFGCRLLGITEMRFLFWLPIMGGF